MIGWLAACASAPDAAPDWRPMVEQWHYTDPLPALPLVDQEGRAFTLDRYVGSYVLVGFVYTACPDAEACPMTTARMASVQRLWASTPRTTSLALLSITLDPARDTPDALKTYGAAHGADFGTWTFATGDAALLGEGVPSLFNVLTLPDDGRIDHTVKLVLLDPTLRQVAEWKDNAVTADEIVARIDHIANP